MLHNTQKSILMQLSNNPANAYTSKYTTDNKTYFIKHAIK